MVNFTHKKTISSLALLLVFNSQLLLSSTPQQPKPEGFLQKCWNALAVNDDDDQSYQQFLAIQTRNVYDQNDSSDDELDPRPTRPAEPALRVRVTDNQTALLPQATLPQESPKDDDEFIDVKKPKTPTFLNTDDFPKQKETTYSSRSDKSMRESYLDFVLRIIEAKQFQAASTKEQGSQQTRSVNIGEDTGRALTQAITAYSTLSSKQGKDLTDLLTAQQPALKADHASSDTLTKAVNQSYVVSGQLIAPNKILEGLTMLEDAEKCLTAMAQQATRELNIRKQALNDMRRELCQANTAQGAQRSISPFKALDLHLTQQQK